VDLIERLRGTMRRGLSAERTQDRRETIIELDFPSCVAREFPEEFPLAWGAVENVLGCIEGVDLSALGRRSPALNGYDWTGYLQCSVARMVRVLRAMRRRGRAGGRVLDYGSYFGNFALMCRRAGWAVDAIDSYQAYSPALDTCQRRLGETGVRVDDFSRGGCGGHDEAGGTYDVILCMGVIEHLAHTPRPVLETLHRALGPGGLLILDTPNLAYAHTRRKLARGESIFAPIQQQYYTELPFEGHHREYTMAEVEWMLDAIGQKRIEISTFNYSHYALAQISGEGVTIFREMERDPSAREVILSVSEKPSAC